MVHPFFSMGGAVDAGRAALTHAAGALRRAFGSDPSGSGSAASLFLRENAIVYIVKLLTGSLIVWYGLRTFGIVQPYWAMISLIVVTGLLASRNGISGRA